MGQGADVTGNFRDDVAALLLVSSLPRFFANGFTKALCRVNLGDCKTRMVDGIRRTLVK